MSIIRRKKEREMPSLNTAALPDLIFTVLFFFMIVTHMQTTPLKVTYEMPDGTEITRLVNKQDVTQIYIGKVGNDYRIQIGDQLVDAHQVEDHFRRTFSHMDAETQRRQVVSIKADRKAPMKIVNDVKQALRRAHAYNINYSATLETAGLDRQ